MTKILSALLVVLFLGSTLGAKPLGAQPCGSGVENVSAKLPGALNGGIQGVVLK